jgi:hypothetical protein
MTRTWVLWLAMRAASGPGDARCWAPWICEPIEPLFKALVLAPRWITCVADSQQAHHG